MPAGLIQLIAYGLPDVFLTGNPQITFFKVVYRRHTNFSIEPIEQFFNVNRVKFGQKISCSLSRTGDLIHKVYLVLDLPIVEKFINKNCSTPNYVFSWARNIGYVLIKTIEIEIGSRLIDRQYGEWLQIWDQLTNNKRSPGFDALIGNVSELTSFSNGKNSYRLYIPLQFWFCKYIGLSLPIVALQYDEVKINLELQEQANCYLIGPTQSIQITNPVVSYKQNEWLQQTVGTTIAMGLFMNFDISTSTLYYIRATDQPFQSFNTSNVSNLTGVDLNAIRQQYKITGLCTNYQVLPVDNVTEQNIKIILPKSIEKMIIPRLALDVLYIYLDTEERFRFINTAHEYLIEQVQLANIKTIQFNQINLNLNLNHPTRALFWVARTNPCINMRDTFNFTNSVVRNLYTDKLCGTNLIKKSQLLLNSVPRFSERDGQYFNWIQPQQYFTVDPEEGINTYSFALSPSVYQTSGTCNMSKMDFISLSVLLDNNAISTISNNSYISVYGLSYNILRVINGLSGLLFSN